MSLGKYIIPMPLLSYNYFSFYLLRTLPFATTISGFNGFLLALVNYQKKVSESRYQALTSILCAFSF